MSEEIEKSAATIFFDEHPELRAMMDKSRQFPEMKKRKALPLMDDEQLYVVRGDTQGDEDELYLDALARGSNPESQDELARALFLELDEHSRSLIMERLGKRQSLL